jgi:hypothetical protein
MLLLVGSVLGSHVRLVAKLVRLGDALSGSRWVGCTHYMNRRTGEADTLLATPI